MRAGAVLLSIWSLVNYARAFALMTVALFGRDVSGPPINACVAAFCALVFTGVWRGLVLGRPWTWFALCATTTALQASGLVSENVVLAALLAVGLALTRSHGPTTAEAQK